MRAKIAFEEHFNVRQFDDKIPQYVNPEMMAEVRAKLLDVAAMRLQEMDAAGIGYALLSLNAPGVQDVPDPEQAVTLARQVNDDLAKVVADTPARYGGMATLPMQDPQAAVAELERCVTQLGFPGVMLNGFTTTPDGQSAWYYDHERFLPFWERVEALDVPVYLHPRNPLPADQRIYAGHPELAGAVWMFTVETANHALRLMTSGLFDRFPQLKIILGHLGETLAFNMWRIEHRITYMGDRKFDRPLGHYLRTNFYVTTSGNFHTPALANTLTELGADHVLFSTDYPYESMREAADWFDNADISEADRQQIGRSNAEKLFNLKE